MSNYHGLIMNLPVVLRQMLETTAEPVDSVQAYKYGHRDARHAAAELANDADARIAELEAEVTAAHGELAAIEVERRGWQRSQETMRRLLALVEEWERANCRSSTYDCAEQVRAILRGEGPQGWEMRAGKEGGE